MRRTVRSGDVDISVAEWGERSRPVVLLLHGYPDNKDVWSRVAERLSDRFHVVAYDVRGHGASSAPARSRGSYRLARLADDFEAVLRAVSPDRPVHLVGHDWGSVQGWEFATLTRFKRRLLSFTSISGPCLDHFGLWIKERSSRLDRKGTVQLAEQLARSWYVYFFRLPVLPELVWRGPFGSRLWPRMLAGASRSPHGYPTASVSRDAVNGLWLYRDNTRERFSRPRRDAVAHVPVQLITPTRDPFLSRHLYGGLERWAPELLRRTVAGTHWLPLSRPGLLSDWISAFAEDVEHRSDSGEHLPNHS